jgi:asparagine N-glycosylation enzyme membrane subunit Stt3
MPIITALGGAAGALVLVRFWHLVSLFSAVVLILGILYTVRIMNAAEG